MEADARLSLLILPEAPGAAEGGAVTGGSARLRRITIGQAGGLQQALARADLIVLIETGLSAAQLESARRCRAVIHAGAGCTTDLEAARERGIYVCSISDTATGACRASAGRMLREFRSAWEGARPGLPGSALRRRPRLGLVGSGRLGLAFAEEARGLKFDVWAFDPFALEESLRALEVRRAPALHDLLGIADLVMVQVGPADSNAGMLGSDALAWIKRGAWLANQGWEPAVDLAAMAEAVRSGRLGRALLARPGAAEQQLASGIEVFDPMRGKEAEIREASLTAALGLADRITRGEEPAPLLIDPPLPRWGD